MYGTPLVVRGSQGGVGRSLFDLDRGGHVIHSGSSQTHVEWISTYLVNQMTPFLP
jgi:hypothetical protein